MTLAERLTVLYDALHPSNSGGQRAWMLRKYREMSGHDVPDSTFYDWIARDRVPNKHWPKFNEVLGDLVREATEQLQKTIDDLDDVL